MGLNLEIDAKIFQLYDLDNKNTVSTANKAHWERELNGKQSSNLLLSRKIKPTVEFLHKVQSKIKKPPTSHFLRLNVY
jgi:hypothetical protein